MATSRRVPLPLLRPGFAVMEGIADPNSPRVRSLGSRVKMTQSFIDGLRRRGVTSFIMASHDIAVLRAFTPQGRRTKVPPAHQCSQSAKINDYTEQFDDTLTDQSTPKLEPSKHLFAGQIETPVDDAYADGLPAEWATKTMIKSILFASSIK